MNCLKLYALSFLLMFSFNQYCKEIINAKCIITDKYKRYMQKMFANIGAALEKKGLRLVNKNVDVILCNEVTKEILDENKPIIILERIDSATLNRSSEKSLVYPQVKAVFKNSILRPKKLHHEGEKVCGRYHFTLLEQYAMLGYKSESFNCSQSLLHKIYCVPWHSSSSCFAPRFDSAKKKRIKFEKARPIDVFFVGNTNCNMDVDRGEYFCWHRNNACATIRSMKNITSLIIDGHPFNYKQYIKKMSEAKIVVSPWGWGEWCYRDCEAMLCGAVLIKPDSSFVKTFPQMYKNNITYVPCKPDFSDLPEKIDIILANYDYYLPMRKRARKLMCDETSIDQLAERFVAKVKEVLKN